MNSQKLRQGMAGIAAVLMHDAIHQSKDLEAEIAFRIKKAGLDGIDLSPIISKAWASRHRYIMRGFGFLSPAAVMLDEFSKDEALPELERLALYHWTAGLLLRSAHTHVLRGGGLIAGARLAECMSLLNHADGLAWPSFAERQARASAVKEARTQSARESAILRHAPTAAAKDAVRAAWASGKYSSRDLCAEQEAAALGISFASARKALRKTPDPA